MSDVSVSTMAEWFDAKISRFCELNDVEAKIDVLTDIKIKLRSLNASENEEISRNLDLNRLLSQLSVTFDRDLTEKMCDVLMIFFAILMPGDVYERYSTEMSQLMSHPQLTVKALVLYEFLNTASKPDKLQHLLTNTDLLVDIIQRIADDSLIVATPAISVIKKIGENVNGARTLFKTQKLLNTFTQLLEKDDTVKFRVYEIVVSIATATKEGFQETVHSGLLHNLIYLFNNSKDILFQLTALEVLTQLALTEEGLVYLEEEGLLRNLVHKIADADVNPLPNLIVSGLMKFFGNIAQHRPNEVFSKYPVVVTALFDVIKSEDGTTITAALDTLGHVATTIEGKYALQDLGDCMPCALKTIAEIIQQLPVLIRVCGLNNLAVILKVNAEEQDNRILSLTKSWFDSLCDDPMGLIVKLCYHPFSEIRQASLEVLAVIASQAWGQEYISTYPGLVEFLLDRNVEKYKECKEAKYDVVKYLSQAEQNIFDTCTMQKFKQFVNEGPFYVQMSTEIAIEGTL